ncbi:MAG: NAD(P)H-hydrate epimerase, partial [Dehalococcoidia bacterium]|nr:NAD(P)H-hydrate epimerase [Dehalococcoidia bacterium]
MRICTVQEIRNCDRAAVENLGLSNEILMENAGHAVVSVIKREFGLSDRRFLVVCGGGNNGGDGLVAARLLFSVGADVHVDLLVDESAYSGSAAVNLRAALACGVPVQRIHTADELRLGRPTDVVVDAIFGTGLSRQPEGLVRDVIERLNLSMLPVLSVDVPSGVNADTGAAPGVAVRAACTVTFGLPKRGNVLPPGRELCGRLYVSHISFPPALYRSVGNVVAGELSPLPPRALESHKGMYGDVLFIAGARSYM